MFIERHYFGKYKLLQSGYGRIMIQRRMHYDVSRHCTLMPHKAHSSILTQKF